MAEMTKTEAGRIRIAAAADRLDRTAAELGQQHRADVPQGEQNGEVVQHQQPEEPAHNPTEFIPLEVPEQHTRPVVQPALQEERLEPEVVDPTKTEWERADRIAMVPGRAVDAVYEAYPKRFDLMTDVSPGMCPPTLLIREEDPQLTVKSRMQEDEDASEAEFKELLSVMTREVKEEIREHEREIVATIRLLGGCEHQYRRKRRKALRSIVVEVYSPPRVTAATKLLPELKIIPGFALDLTTVDADGKLWDFDDKVMRDRALQRVKEERPMLLIGSPMCTAFSTWQRINDKNRSPVVVAAEKKRAIKHLESCVQLYLAQTAGGRYYLHEHPAYASSWQTGVIEGPMSEKGTIRVVGDQCVYGAADEEGSPVKKPTGFMTNSPAIAGELSARCMGRHGACSRPEGGMHRQCRGKVAQMAAVYDFKLCRAILVGFRKQMNMDGKCKDGFICLVESGTERSEAMPALPVYRVEAKGEAYNIEVDGDKVYRDDLTGQPLDLQLVREARQKELDFFEAKKVWTKRSVVEARRRTGKSPISVRWVDVNKGDDISPNIRSRLVARQIRQPGEEAIFAPTPPLEPLRTIISIAATEIEGRKTHVRDPLSDRRTQISAIEFSRAYFNASVGDASDPTYVPFPPEHPNFSDGNCAMLLKHMYGTRAAADGWQQEYSSFMRSIGFSLGEASPCVFIHHASSIARSVHGDDFTSTGKKRHLDWQEEQLASKYELRKGGRLGPGADDAKELTVLNRILRYTDEGYEYEADPRQGEKFLEGLRLDGGCKGAATPGLKPLVEQLEKDKEIPAGGQTEFRGHAARGNYLSADRVDLKFVAKEICRLMSSPTETSAGALKRMGRYLLDHKRPVYTYPWQEASGIDVYSDTDWPGGPRTRRSTSGGCVMFGKHAIRTWSSTQPSVTFSSGEAEFYGLVKAAGAGLGHQSIMRDFGLTTPVRVWTDSSAALGISTRSGLGKLRHLETHTLWVQKNVGVGAIQVRKVRGDVNPADLFTKHLGSEEKRHQLVKLFGCEYRSGRSEAAPVLRPQEKVGVRAARLPPATCRRSCKRAMRARSTTSTRCRSSTATKI